MSTRVLPLPAGAMTRAAPASCIDRFELVGRELGGGGCVAVGGEQALLDGVAVDERVTVGELQAVRTRPAVAPRGTAVEQCDIGRGVFGRAEALRFDARAPHHAPVAVVVVVGAGEEVEALLRELEARRERVGRRVSRSRDGAVRSASQRSSTTTGSRRDQCRCSASHASAGACKVASSMTTRGAPVHALGSRRIRGNDHAPAEPAGNLGIGQSGHGSHVARRV